MATLTDDVKEFIVKGLACFDTPSYVAEAVKVNFGLEITRQQVYAYDPRCSQPPAPRWRALHAATRAKFLHDVSEIGIAQKAVRLRMLDRLAHRCERNSVALAMACLQQAAKECGGIYENRRPVVLQVSAPQPAAPQPAVAPEFVLEAQPVGAQPVEAQPVEAQPVEHLAVEDQRQDAAPEAPRLEDRRFEDQRPREAGEAERCEDLRPDAAPETHRRQNLSPQALSPQHLRQDNQCTEGLRPHDQHMAELRQRLRERLAAAAAALPSGLG